jgi:hypothetical protein
MFGSSAQLNRQRCGTRAANDLDGFIAQRPVSCTPVSLGTRQRYLLTFVPQPVQMHHHAINIVDEPDHDRYQARPVPMDVTHLRRTEIVT